MINKDSIIKLIEKASDIDKVYAWQNGFWVLTQEELERFAKLLLSEECEACTKEKALDLALEALDTVVWDSGWIIDSDKMDTAITAIKQARALDKMAENARELGLNYEPVAPVQEDWGPGPHEYHSLTAAQRQWVGLTDAEVMQIMNGDWTSQFYFAQAIEAKLKEKNT